MATIRELVGPQVRRDVEDDVARARSERRNLYVPLDLKKADDAKDGRIWFEGMANVATIDRTGDLIEPRAFAKALKLFLKYNPQMFYQHDWWMSVGQFTDGEVRENGLWVRGYLAPVVDDEGLPLGGSIGDFLRMVRGQVKRGQLRTLSIGFRPLEKKSGKAKDPMTNKERDVTIITLLELYEISLVTLPASRESVIEVRSAFAERYGQEVADSLVVEFDEPETRTSADCLIEAVRLDPEPPEHPMAKTGDTEDHEDEEPEEGKQAVELVSLREIEKQKSEQFVLRRLDHKTGRLINE